MFFEYEKKNLSIELKESEGWTKQLSDDIESLLIYPEEYLDCSTLNRLYFGYGFSI